MHHTEGSCWPWPAAVGVLLSRLLIPPQGSVPKALLALNSAYQNCTGSHSDLKWNWAFQYSSSNLACIAMLLIAPTGGFKKVLNPNSCTEVVGTINTKGSSSRILPFLFPRPTARPVPPRGRAGRLQHGHVGYWRDTFHPSHRLLRGPHLQFWPAILFSKYSLSIVYLCHLLFLPSLTFRTPVYLIFVFWGDFSPLLPPTCHFPWLPTGALKIFPVLWAFIVFCW